MCVWRRDITTTARLCTEAARRARAFCVSLLIRETDHRNGAAGGLIQVAASLVVPFAFVCFVLLVRWGLFESPPAHRRQ